MLRTLLRAALVATIASLAERDKFDYGDICG
jgi:hypothetical protein